MDVKTRLLVAMIYGSTCMLAACAHPGHERAGKEVVSDATITTKVKAALLAEKDIHSMAISVTTFKGEVQLSGFVDSQWQIDKAVVVTKSVNGVTAVKNDLIHKPASDIN